MIFEVLKNTFFGKKDNKEAISKIGMIKTTSILNLLFIIILMLNAAICFFFKEWLLLYATIFLLATLFMARILINRSQHDLAATVSAIAAFIVAVAYSIFTGDIIMPYFILLLSPLLSAVTLNNFKYKIFILTSSFILSFVCNHFAENNIFDNFLFLIALVPSFFGLLYFYNKLQLLEKNQHQLIQALELKNQETVLFSQMMSHDLKAPLRSIKGFSGLLKRKIAPKEGSSEADYLNFIINNAETMTILIDDLLAYSKAGTDKYEFQSIDLEQFIDEQKTSFSYQINEGLLAINTTNLGTIEGNPNALQTVFQNLISNAVKYQPKGKESHQAVINIDYKEKETHHHITFQDNGIGIKEEYLTKLFLPFTRFHTVAEYEGTGLGLSICKKILNKHNGDISVSSTSEKGTCFLIEIAKDLRYDNPILS